MRRSVRLGLVRIFQLVELRYVWCGVFVIRDPHRDHVHLQNSKAVQA
jgi:hypothetical protein